MNKKAEWGQAPTLLDWVAYIFLILIIVVAVVIFSWHSTQIQNKIKTMAPEQEKGNLLVNILRTPVDAQGASTMGELIAGWYLNVDKFTSEDIRTRLNKILNNVYGYEVSWVLKVEDKQIPTLEDINLGKQVSSFETDMPLLYNSNLLSVHLRLFIYDSVVKEGTLCLNLAAQRCSVDDKLCQCDGFKWQNCKKCDKGCNKEKNECNA